MPIRSNRYDAITDGGATDSRSRGVLHGEEDFQVGITFIVKYIGTQDVEQPHNRVEIVAAMRRIRFECKARRIKKQKINFIISVNGVKVVLFRRNKKNYQAQNFPIIEHPIYRIFYVSHDSHDLLIFSYISREASTNQFRCNVFKAFKKSHAVEVVRTIGQAFDICHRMAIEAELNNPRKTKDDDNNETAQHADSCQMNGPCALATSRNSMEPVQSSLDSGHSTGSEDVIQGAQRVLAVANFKPSSIPVTAFRTVGTIASPVAPLSLALPDDVAMGDEVLSGQHQIQLLLQHQKEFQSQQMHCLLSQMQLLKDQLAAETDARIDAQSRIHQLLGQNQELLEHINMLVQRLVQLEASHLVKTEPEITQYPKIPYLPTNSTTASSVLLPVRSCGASTLPRAVQSPGNQVAASAQNVSPDSGHREMSSDSLSVGNCTAAQLSLRSWQTLPTTSQTVGKTAAFDVKQSLITVAGAKSLEISKVADELCVNDYSSKEKRDCEEATRNAPQEQLSPRVLPANATLYKSSIVSVQTEYSYNSQLASETVTQSPGLCTFPTPCDDVSGNVSSQIITSDPMDNSTTSA